MTTKRQKKLFQVVYTLSWHALQLSYFLFFVTPEPRQLGSSLNCREIPMCSVAIYLLSIYLHPKSRFVLGCKPHCQNVQAINLVYNSWMDNLVSHYRKHIQTYTTFTALFFKKPRRKWEGEEWDTFANSIMSSTIQHSSLTRKTFVECSSLSSYSYTKNNIKHKYKYKINMWNIVVFGNAGFDQNMG